MATNNQNYKRSKLTLPKRLSPIHIKSFEERKAHNQSRKQQQSRILLSPINDPDLPPLPEAPPNRKDNTLIVISWDVKVNAHSNSLLEIGAFCPKLTNTENWETSFDSSLEDTILADRDNFANIETKATKKGVDFLRSNERTFTSKFLDWLRTVSTNCGGNGVLLLSHSAISSKLPKFMVCVKRHRLQNELQQVRQIVKGFCDIDSRLLCDDADAVSLCELSREILGEEISEQQSAAMVAAQIYRLLCAFFRRDILSARLSPLPRSSWSWECVERFAQWRLRTDHHANDLRVIFTTKVARGVKRKRALIKNLLAIGYTYQSLNRDYVNLGEYTFREVLSNKLRYMKRTRESPLTETRDVGCTTVLESVIQHFREIDRDRAVKLGSLPE